MKFTFKNPKIILVPYPAQGHVTPMLNLASALAHRGLSPVVVTPEFIHRRIAPKTDVACFSIPDGLGEEPRDFFSIEFAMEHNMPAHLDRLVRELNGGDGGDGGVACMIVDVLASWAFKVGEERGVAVVGYWPVMFAAYQIIAAIPHMLSLGIISETGIPTHEGPIHLADDKPPLSSQELPWLIGNLTARKSRFKFWTRTLSRTTTLKRILVNTFPDEHHTGFNQPTTIADHHHYPIGPLTQHTRSINPSFLEEDRTCLKWLDQQPDGSVVYISFGSWVSPIGETKVAGLAMALESSSRRRFVWVLGTKWREGLPKGYAERVSDRGRLVSWAPQVEVLRHKAVGCYLTHCGWNSTIEAIQNKVRLLCYPIAGDQFVNCDYIVKVWRIGVRMNGFEEEEVEESLGRVMGDREMEERLGKLNQRVFGKETSSRVNENLTSFVDDLKQGFC